MADGVQLTNLRAALSGPRLVDRIAVGLARIFRDGREVRQRMAQSFDLAVPASALHLAIAHVLHALLDLLVALGDRLLQHSDALLGRRYVGSENDPVPLHRYTSSPPHRLCG